MSGLQTLRLYRSRWWLLYAPLLLLVLSLLHLARTQWLPLPPRQLTLAVSSAHGEELARRYERELALGGVAVQTLKAKTDEQVLEWLTQGQADVALAITPSLMVSKANEWVHVGAIERLAVWLFTRMGPGLSSDALKNAAVGWVSFDANDAWLWPELRQQSQLSAAQASATPVTERDGVLALLDGRLDALALVAHAQHPAVARLNREPNIHVMSTRLNRAAASQRGAVHAVALPQGALDVRNNLPGTDTSMLAVYTHLLASPKLPTATQELLWDVASNIHEQAQFLTRQGEFPMMLDDLGASFQRKDRQMAQMLLPYWWAQLAELVLFAVLPIVLCAVFLFSIFPRLFERRFDASLQQFYGELAFLQADLGSEVTGVPKAIARLQEQIEDIERRVMQLQLPENQIHRWYTLRQHVELTRKQILGLRAR
jgi:hypothetical protein